MNVKFKSEKLNIKLSSYRDFTCKINEIVYYVVLENYLIVYFKVLNNKVWVDCITRNNKFYKLDCQVYKSIQSFENFLNHRAKNEPKETTQIAFDIWKANNYVSYEIFALSVSRKNYRSDWNRFNIDVPEKLPKSPKVFEKFQKVADGVIPPYCVQNKVSSSYTGYNRNYGNYDYCD